jgi:hypothetical protein
MEQMREATAGLEAQLIDASGDGQAYAQILGRRAAMLREVERLEHAVVRERREHDAAHRQALRQRFDDAVATAAAIRQEGAAVDAEIGETRQERVAAARRGTARRRRWRLEVPLSRPALADATPREHSELNRPRRPGSPFDPARPKAVEPDPKITTALQDIAQLPPATSVFGQRPAPPAVPWAPEGSKEARRTWSP